MKRILIVLLTLALVAGLAFASGNKDAEKTWSVSGGVAINGKINLGNDVGAKSGEEYGEPSIGYGDLDAGLTLVMAKDTKDGTFGFGFEIDQGGGIAVGVDWVKALGDGSLNATVGFAQADEGEDDYSTLSFQVGYAADTYAANLSFKKDGNGSSGWSFFAGDLDDFRTGWDLDALNGWFSVLDGDLIFSVRYTGGRGGFFGLGHSIVARTWDGADKSLEIVYSPTALIEGLTVGIAIQNIDEGRAKEQFVDGLLFGVKFQNDMFGAKFVFDNGYRGLWGDVNDDPGWITNNGWISNFETKTGMQIGVDVVLGDIYIAVDSEILGLDDPLKVTSFLGLGAVVGYGDDNLDASLKLKMYTAIQDKDKVGGSDAGVFAIQPSIGYKLIPDHLKVGLGMDIILGFGEFMSDADKNAWTSFKVNPNLTWNPNGNGNVAVKFGWTLKSEGMKEKLITDHNINLGFSWNF